MPNAKKKKKNLSKRAAPGPTPSGSFQVVLSNKDESHISINHNLFMAKKINTTNSRYDT